jgi:HAD superfamily hydrolase (TIGR01490 family)
MKQADQAPDAAAYFMAAETALRRIAIYDVDRTLTRRPTWSLFLLQSMAFRAPWRAVLIPLLIPVALAYALRLIPRRLMKQAMHWAALGPHIARNEAMVLADRFAQSVFADGLYDQGVAQIAKDRADGWHIMLATAAPDFYIEPLARRLAITDWVATRSLWQDDGLSCRIDGENCYGQEKLRRIQEALEHRGIRRDQAYIRFYSDDISDKPVCEWVDEPVAVNPGNAMARLARQSGWHLFDWRQP